MIAHGHSTETELCKGTIWHWGADCRKVCLLRGWRMAKQPTTKLADLPQELSILIDKYDDDSVSSKKQSEAMVRGDYIDALIGMLGWDLTNKEGVVEFFRDVVREDKQEVDGSSKKPDYAICYGKEKLFYIEAKKPSIDLKYATDAAYQIRCYGWSAGMAVCLLTSFREFAIYDTTIKPLPNDRAAIARIFYCTYDQLGEPHKDCHTNWDFICGLLSKEAVRKGALQKIRKSDRKKGTQTVDEEFLKEIERWRESLAHNIAHNNNFDNSTLNEIVQKTIDRLIFLRICEDRGIEPENTLKKITDTRRKIYDQLFELFKESDAKYNSGLFFFDKHNKDKGITDMPDQVSGSTKISDKPLLDIIKQLYYPSPYQFSEMPADILGSVYERFLGKKIRLTSKNRCEVVCKPEVTKAGGVYYTPRYIVEYIVNNTLGEQLKTKNLNTIKNYRIVDPACGSGSFLIVAYQILLDWYLEQYIMDTAKHKKHVWKMPDRTYKLRVTERKRILTEHIYGVDIDRQAVEVTKLSLLLKTLEGVKEQEIQHGLMELLPERALPNLSGNIKCGNSLIDTSYHDYEISIEDEEVIKPFSWQHAFAEIFRQGGFDAVIGNPPYVIVFNSEIKAYLEDKFPEFQRNNDLYVAFIIKCFQLLKNKGICSLITPNSFVRGDHFNRLRRTLNQYQINEIVDFGNKLIFSAANVYTCIFNITKDAPNTSWIMKTNLNGSAFTIKSDKDTYVPDNYLIDKLDKLPKLDEYMLVKDVGYNYWSIGRGKQRGGSIGSKILYKGKKQRAKDIPYLKGSNFNRYTIEEPTHYLRHDYEKYLNNDDVFRFTSEIMETTPKLIYRQTSSSLIGTLEPNGLHNDKTVHIILPKQGIKVNLKYVLGLFNSKLLNYYYSMLVNESGRAFAQVKTVNVKRLPFVMGDNNAQKQIVKHVDLLLQLNIELNNAAFSTRKEQINSRIAYSEDRIDTLVYEIYGLTDAEIVIVEGA